MDLVFIWLIPHWIVCFEYTSTLRRILTIMSSIIRKVESDAEIAFRNNPTSPKAPRDVYIKVLAELTNGLENASTDTKRSQIEVDICDLYISRAAMEIRLKQKKQAKLVFDEALSRDYCKKSAKLWKAYISFYIKEGKIESARKYFEKAVNSVDVSFNSLFDL